MPPSEEFNSPPDASARVYYSHQNVTNKANSTNASKVPVITAELDQQSMHSVTTVSTLVYNKQIDINKGSQSSGMMYDVDALSVLQSHLHKLGMKMSYGDSFKKVCVGEFLLVIGVTFAIMHSQGFLDDADENEYPGVMLRGYLLEVTSSLTDQGSPT